MRYFEQNDVTVLSDIGREEILEEAISCLLEGGRNPEDGAELLRSDAVKRRLLKKLGRIYDDSYAGYVKDILNWLEHKEAAVERLKELLPDDKDRLVDIVGFVRNDVLDRIICPGELKVLNRIPVGLCLTILAGYAFDANGGITFGIISLPGQKLYVMVKEVWGHAMDELHPFQRGPTHQGSKHCIQVLNNLDALKRKLGITMFDERVGAMLSIAAALHDIGKGDILAPPPSGTPLPSDKHAQNGATVIENQPGSLKLDDVFKDFVAEIVRAHNPEAPLCEIDKLGIRDLDPTDKYGAYVPNVDMKKVCALFQLADVLDLTRDRVSDAVFDMLKQLHPGDPDMGRIQDIVEARKGIKDWGIVPGTDAHIQVYMVPSTPYGTAVQKRIRAENRDLSTTGATAVLQNSGWLWPDVLR